MFRHLVRFCRSYIRSVIMFHMAKHSGIQSIFCDLRHATTSSLGMNSSSSHYAKNGFMLAKNDSLVHKPRNFP